MRRMPTAAAVVALAMALTGCQRDEPIAAPPPASSVPKVAPKVKSVPKPKQPKAPTVPAANGVAALRADDILRHAKAALEEAKSFRFKGAVNEGGRRTGVDFTVSGNDYTGLISIGRAQVELLVVDDEKYFRPNKAFWVMSTNASQGNAVARIAGGRWIAGADKDPSMAKLFTAGSIDAMLSPSGVLSKGKQTKIGGVPAIGLKDAGAAGTVFYVATTGRPYPLRIVGDAGSALVFNAFGKAVTGIRKPTGKQVVDVEKLAGG